MARSKPYRGVTTAQKFVAHCPRTVRRPPVFGLLNPRNSRYRSRQIKMEQINMKMALCAKARNPLTEWELASQ